MSGQSDFVQMVGIGSLLSERSARTTVPNLRNFRTCKIKGWRRVFTHTPAIFHQRGIANLHTGEMASLSMEAAETAPDVIVSLFEVPAAEFPGLIEREREYILAKVTPYTMDDEPLSFSVVMCAVNTDQNYRALNCQAHDVETSCLCELCLLKPYGVDRMWRDDILPCRIYLRHVILAATALGQAVLDNFLDSTFLANRTTTIREHLAANSSIVNELPPPELQERYGG